MPAFQPATGGCNRVRIGMSNYNIALPANTDDLVAIHQVHWLKARTRKSVSGSR